MKDWQNLHYYDKEGIVCTQYSKLASWLRYYIKDAEELEPVNVRVTADQPETIFYRFKVKNMWRAYRIMDDNWGDAIVQETSFNRGGW